MTPLTWHIERSKVVLDEWYEQMHHFRNTAQEFSGMMLSYPNTVNFCNQNALKCKILGLVFSDRYKMMLENVK